MIYVDTSALVKLVLAEGESEALRTYLGSDPDVVSSALLGVEARRAILRKRPSSLPRIDILLDRTRLIDVSNVILDRAGRLPDPLLRSLDAIHLATATSIRDEVEVLLTYDDRLAEAARALDIPTVAPA